MSRQRRKLKCTSDNRDRTFVNVTYAHRLLRWEARQSGDHCETFVRKPRAWAPAAFRCDVMNHYVLECFWLLGESIGETPMHTFEQCILSDSAESLCPHFAPLIVKCGILCKTKVLSRRSEEGCDCEGLQPESPRHPAECNTMRT